MKVVKFLFEDKKEMRRAQQSMPWEDEREEERKRTAAAKKSGRQAEQFKNTPRNPTCSCSHLFLSWSFLTLLLFLISFLAFSLILFPSFLVIQTEISLFTGSPFLIWWKKGQRFGIFVGCLMVLRFLVCWDSFWKKSQPR